MRPVYPRATWACVWSWLVIFALTMFAGTASHSAQERYDYDALGRLIRVIDEQGRVTQYTYDAAGNILSVVTDAAAAQPPSVTSIDPNSIRRGETRQITINGANLTGVDVTVADPALDISGVKVGASQVVFSLTAGLTTALGAQQIRLASAAGSVNASITINSVLPKVSVEPTPLAIPPDNVARSITIRLSSTDTIDHSIALSSSNVNMVVAPASVTIPAGQSQVAATVRGVTAGQASLILTSATLGNTSVPVFITGEFLGISTSYSLPLGIVLQGTATPPQVSRTLFSGTVGVAVGRYLRSIAPKNFAIGSGPTTMTITGAGLDVAQSVTVTPSTGVTLGTITPAPDGQSLSIPITVAADAPTTQRQVVVTGPAGVFAAASPDADRINIVRPAPEVTSFEPIFALRGTVLSLTVRGRNLHDTQVVAMSPATGIAVGMPPAVAADGTSLTVGLSVDGAAPLGEKKNGARLPS